MDTKVLVAYATKYGATTEIAEKIGEILRQSGFDTDVLPADRIRNLSSYNAIILGSGVYIGRWRKEASNFLKTNEKILTEKLVWLFSSGPTGEGDPVELMKGWYFPNALKPIADRIQPKDIAVFHGSLNREKLSFIEKWMIKNVKAPIGDFRNWDSIVSWAKDIANKLKEAQ